MNNSNLGLEHQETTDEQKKSKLRSEESRLVKIIDALRGIQGSKEWSTLKEEIFDERVKILSKELRVEAETNDPDPKKLNRITGELLWARKFSDLSKLETEKGVELQRIRLYLYGKTE